MSLDLLLFTFLIQSLMLQVARSQKSPKGYQNGLNLSVTELQKQDEQHLRNNQLFKKCTEKLRVFSLICSMTYLRVNVQKKLKLTG